MNRHQHTSRLLARLSLLPALLTAACFAGEPIAPGSARPLPGHYAVSVWSFGPYLEDFPLPLEVEEKQTSGEEEQPSARRYEMRFATLVLHEEGKYDEEFEIAVWERSIFPPYEEVLVDVILDRGQGTWSASERDVVFTAAVTPAVFDSVFVWTGRQGDGGDFALNVAREGDELFELHYRRDD